MAQQRITMKMLDNLAKIINAVAGTPKEYSPNAKGHFYFAAAYGGYRLEQIANDNGGTRAVGGSGYVTAREAYAIGEAYYYALYDVSCGRVTPVKV